jgi:serine/threonine protein kinase
MINKYYQLKDEIGQGTFGKVYLGIHVPTGSSVAIKILDKSKIRD